MHSSKIKKRLGLVWNPRSKKLFASDLVRPADINSLTFRDFGSALTADGASDSGFRGCGQVDPRTNCLRPLRDKNGFSYFQYFHAPSAA